MQPSPMAAGCAVFATILSLIACSGCDDEFLGFSPNNEPKYAIVFVDASSSIRQEDRSAYKSSFDSLLQSLGPGDRVEVAAISQNTLTHYSALADETIASTGVRIADVRQLKAARAKLAQSLDATFERAAPATRILDALAIAQQRFAADDAVARPRKWLVLLSDMLEESDELNLVRRAFPAAEDVEKFIVARREKNRVPDLSGVEIFVGGATAPDVKGFESAQQFWTAYFLATGATFPTRNYQRAPLRFP